MPLLTPYTIFKNVNFVSPVYLCCRKQNDTTVRILKYVIPCQCWAKTKSPDSSVLTTESTTLEIYLYFYTGKNVAVSEIDEQNKSTLVTFNPTLVTCNTAVDTFWSNKKDLIFSTITISLTPPVRWWQDFLQKPSSRRWNCKSEFYIIFLLFLMNSRNVA